MRMLDRSESRIEAMCAIAGSVLLFVGTYLHPMEADPNEAIAAFVEYAADHLWVASHLTQLLVPIIIGMFAAGAATNHDGLMTAGLIVGPLVGLAAPYAWVKARRPRAGQASRYQAVYASSLDLDFSGVPTGFVITFENNRYSDRFLALNKDVGVAAG